jgi:hypothetical protein
MEKKASFKSKTVDNLKSSGIWDRIAYKSDTAIQESQFVHQSQILDYSIFSGSFIIGKIGELQEIGKTFHSPCFSNVLTIGCSPSLASCL